MFKKLTHNVLKLGIAAVVVTYILVMVIFFPGSLGHTLAQKDTRLSVAPNPANPGATIMVNGFNYSAAQKVEIYFQNKANGVVSATTNAGGFFNVPLRLPEKYIDGATFVYVASDGFTTKAPLTFVRPTLAYKSSVKSARTSFTGTGFLPNETVQYVLHAGNQTFRGTSRTDSHGRLSLSLILPHMPFGTKATLTVNGSTHKALASVSVRYTPRLHLTTFTGSVDDKPGIEGSGYKAHEIVVITFQGKVINVVRADRHGDFFTRFAVPSWAGRSPFYNDVQAFGTWSGATAVGSFQVLPSIYPDTSTGWPGQHITALGSQFTPGRSVQILLFNPSQGDSCVGTPLAIHGASSKGTFKVHFDLPGNLQRRTVYSIVYIDVASGLNVTTYFKVQ